LIEGGSLLGICETISESINGWQPKTQDPMNIDSSRSHILIAVNYQTLADGGDEIQFWTLEPQFRKNASMRRFQPKSQQSGIKNEGGAYFKEPQMRAITKSFSSVNRRSSKSDGNTPILHSILAYTAYVSALYALMNMVKTAVFFSYQEVPGP